MLKVCPRCQREFPATKEYFVLDKRNSSGLGASCRSCERARGRKFIQDHPEKKREQNKKYDAANPEKMRELKYRWRDNNLQKAKAAKQRYNEANHEKLLTKDREYKAKNREKIRERNRTRNRTPERLEDLRRQKARREARKLNLPALLTKSEWLQAIEHWHGCCVYCGQKPDSLTLDHYVPLIDSNCPGTVANNIVPACLSCNSSKNNTEAFYWLSWKFGVERADEVIGEITDYFNSLDSNP